MVDNVEPAREPPLDKIPQPVSLRRFHHSLERLLALVPSVHVNTREQQVTVLAFHALELEEPGVRLTGGAGPDVDKVVGAYVVAGEGLEEGA